MEIEYEGTIYNNIDGKWYLNYMEVPSSLQSKLNFLVSEQNDKENLSLEELIEYGDGYKKTGSYTLAIEYYQKAIDKYRNEENIKLNLPKLTSCLRLVGKPNKAIEIYKKFYEIYSKKIDSDALYTSLAAAYCDVNDFVNGKKYADRAFAITKGIGKNVAPELMLVYERIKKNS